MKTYNTADTDGLLGVAFAALRYLEAREATAEARKERAEWNEKKFWCKDAQSRLQMTDNTNSAHFAVMSAAARQSAAMRWLKRCAKQLEDTA